MARKKRLIRFGKKGCLGTVFICFILIAIIFSALAWHVNNSNNVLNDLCGPGYSANLAALPNDFQGFNKEQLANAALIMNAGRTLNLSARDQTIAVMTAIGESGLRVLDRGDTKGPDSRGLFQQRDNGAWGSYEDRMNPTKSATMFYKALSNVSNRNIMQPTLVANKVQRNADPYHYKPYWETAQEIVKKLGGIDTLVVDAPDRQVHEDNVYSLPNLQPHTLKMANTIGPMFGFKKGQVGGWRATDAFPYHPGGIALDFMVGKDKAKGDKLAVYLQTNAKVFSINHIIWYNKVWSVSRSKEGWRKYTGGKGDATTDHRDHVHVDFLKDPKAAPDAGAMPAVAIGSEFCDTTGGMADLQAVGQVASTGWAVPAYGPITSGFGPRNRPTGGASRNHAGVDIGAPCGRPIFAANAGTVTQAGPAGGYGNLITIDHGGASSRYGHIYAKDLLVKVGQKVQAGALIAKVGSAGVSTGCHLHFEIKSNARGTFVDPKTFMQKYGVTLGVTKATRAPQKA